MSIPWQPLRLDLLHRLLTLTTTDGSVSLTFDLALEADDQTLTLGSYMVEAPGEFPPGAAVVLPLRFHTPPLDWEVTMTSEEPGTVLIDPFIVVFCE